MSEAKSSLIRQIEEDHKQLAAFTKSLTSAVGDVAKADDFPAWKREFVWQLRDFYNLLLKHFELEEEGGYMNDLMELAPRFAGKAESLHSEHQAILRDLDGIITGLKAVTAASEVGEVQERLTALVGQLECHECAEREMLADAYYQDIGAAG